MKHAMAHEASIKLRSFAAGDPKSPKAMGQLHTLLWAEPPPLADVPAAAPVPLPGAMGFAFSGLEGG